MKHRIIVNAGLLVRDKRGRLFMQKHIEEGIWEFPCCEMQEGEELEQTLIHHFQRYTRLHVTQFGLHKIFSGEKMQFQGPDGTEFEMVLFMYEAEVDLEDIDEKLAADHATLLCSDEYMLYRFVDMMEMEFELCSAVQRPLLDYFIRSYKQEMLIR